MTQRSEPSNPGIRYEPEDKPGWPLSAGLALQSTVIVLAGIILTPAVVVRAAGQGEAYLGWAVTAAVMVSGLSTILQSARLGRLGSGYPLVMGTSGAFIAVCIAALNEGGAALLGALVLVSSLFQFLMAYKLSWLRRVVTPPVTGTVVALIAITVFPIVSDLLSDAPEDAPAHAAPLVSALTFLTILGISLLARGAARLWAPLIGIAAGSALAVRFGIYDFSLAAEAPWFGLPDPGAWPGLALELPPAFWLLLPAFVFVTLVGAMETMGDAVAIQQVSRRRPGAVDFRSIQGSVAADGVGNLLSGLAGTVPNTTYSSSIAVVEITGIAARRVGVCVGAIIALIAFFPKLTYLLASIPGPVAGGYLVVIFGILMIQGMKLVLHRNRDSRSATIAGLSILIGMGFQFELIYPELVGGALAGVLGNGMTVGGLTALALTVMLELAGPRRRTLQLPLRPEAERAVVDFLEAFGARCGWDEGSTARLRSAGGETVLALLESKRAGPGAAGEGALRLSAKRDHDAVELEFISGGAGTNLEDQMAMLDGHPDRTDGAGLPLKIISHFSSMFRHHQYHGVDIMTLRVERAAPFRP